MKLIAVLVLLTPALLLATPMPSRADKGDRQHGHG